MDAFWDKIIDICTQAGSKIILAILIFIVGKIIISKLLKLLKKGKGYNRMDATVQSFFMNFAKIVLYVVLVVSIISVLGVPMASVVTVLASCGVAVGLALQGALANIAGGIMLLIFRPFNVGDYIAAAGEEGVVKSISLFYTVINTVDNKEITIPNGALMNANVSNFSSEEKRRVDLSFNISGGEDISKVQETILGVIQGCEKALDDPAPFVAPVGPVPGGLEYTVRVWCNSADYWDVHFDLMKRIPTAIGAAGFAGPAPATKVVIDK